MRLRHQKEMTSINKRNWTPPSTCFKAKYKDPLFPVFHPHPFLPFLGEGLSVRLSVRMSVCSSVSIQEKNAENIDLSLWFYSCHLQDASYYLTGLVPLLLLPVQSLRGKETRKRAIQRRIRKKKKRKWKTLGEKRGERGRAIVGSGKKERRIPWQIPLITHRFCASKTHMYDEAMCSSVYPLLKKIKEKTRAPSC